MKRLATIFGFAAWLLAVAPDISDAEGDANAGSMPLPLKVDKTHVVNSRGDRVRLRGVNIPSLAWKNDGDHAISAIEVAIRDWHVNIIRLALAQDRWLGKAGQKDGGESYRALVHQAIELCASHGCYINLVLLYSDGGDLGDNIDEHYTADRNSLAFWKEVAQTYKNQPAVIFELYNEPHNVSWDVWRGGGHVTETLKGGKKHEYDAVGMQEMLDTVRATGALNVVVVSGLAYSSDVSWFLKGNRLDDPKGQGMLYGFHWYWAKGENTAQRIRGIEKAARSLPIIFSEFGAGGRNSDPHFTPAQRESGERWLREVLQALEDDQMDWTAWCMDPGTPPCLIKGWNYTPTPWFGEWVQKALHGDLPRYTPPPEPVKK